MATTNTVTERSSARYTTVLLDEDGLPVILSVLTSLQLWLQDVSTEEFINAREAQNVLNTNNVTYHATSGLLTWLVQPADNVILGEGATETHHATFHAKWSAGAKGKTWQVVIKVTNYLPIVD